MSATPDPFELLLPAAQRSLAAIAARLPPDWTLTNPRRTATGWAVSIYAADGTYAGEIGIMGEPADDPRQRTPPERAGA
jgi:hypothetical protein